MFSHFVSGIEVIYTHVQYLHRVHGLRVSHFKKVFKLSHVRHVKGSTEFLRHLLRLMEVFSST